MASLTQHWLIADPRTGLVVRRAHEPATVKEGWLSSLCVTAPTWKSYRAGDPVGGADLNRETYQKWMRARKAAR